MLIATWLIFSYCTNVYMIMNLFCDLFNLFIESFSVFFVLFAYILSIFSALLIFSLLLSKEIGWFAVVFAYYLLIFFLFFSHLITTWVIQLLIIVTYLFYVDSNLMDCHLLHHVSYTINCVYQLILQFVYSIYSFFCFVYLYIYICFLFCVFFNFK